MTRPPGWNRRDWMKTATAAGLASGLSPAARAATPADPDRIRIENAKSGTRDWINTNVRVDPKTKFRSPGIEGYLSRSSVRPGESLTLHVSTNPASRFTVELYRMGFYQGHGARLVEKLGSFPGQVQPDPEIGPMRLRECRWEPCVTITIPDDWVSGVYLGKLKADREGLESYVVFVVRDDRKADYLLQVSDHTWNAYNRWPSNFALYDDGKKSWYWGPDVQTSFDRPYGKYCQIFDAPLSVGSGEWLLWEFPLAFWMEEHGYDVTYISNFDTHFDPEGLRRAKGWISIGHDEYWSLEMFETMKKARDEGLNIAFLSGNAICGVVDIHPSSDGRPGRIIERVGRFGSPRQGELDHGFPEEALFKKNGPNEATLIGAQSTYPVTGGGDWICRQPDHWLFAGSEMKEGDAIGGLVGWEWHGEPGEIPGLEVVASGPTKSPRGEGVYTATIYPGPKGNIIFNAATIWWATGLSAPPGFIMPNVYTQPKGVDPRVQKITANLLERLRSTA